MLRGAMLPIPTIGRLRTGLVVLLVLVLLYVSVTVVPAGHAGVKDFFGNVSDTALGPGMSLIVPGTRVLGLDFDAYIKVGGSRGERGCERRGRSHPGAHLPWPAAHQRAAVEPVDGAMAAFDLDHDAFAFANLVRAERPGWNDAFANYCLVIARAASQFYRFARFAADRPAASPEEYDRLVRAVLSRRPWAPPATEAERVVIPGYADLRTFSAAHEGTIKTAFGSNVLSMMHWRTCASGSTFCRSTRSASRESSSPRWMLADRYRS